MSVRPMANRLQPGPIGDETRRRLDLELAARLRAGRRRVGSLRQVERMTGVSRGFLSLLERGMRCPSTWTVERLSQLLDPALVDDLEAAAVPWPSAWVQAKRARWAELKQLPPHGKPEDPGPPRAREDRHDSQHRNRP